MARGDGNGWLIFIVGVVFLYLVFELIVRWS